jgi:hypothetical protein
MPNIHHLEAQALAQAFATLADSISRAAAARASDPTARSLSVTPPGPCRLMLRSGVAHDNDNEVGFFRDPATAALCGRFLMALDSVYHPEYHTFEVLPVTQDVAPAPDSSIRPGVYQHYKGGRYEVLDVATHSETQAPMVVYRALYGTRGLWVRPLEMFLEHVIVEGVSVPRFARQEDVSTAAWLPTA